MATERVPSADFIFAAGDDRTDEDPFERLSSDAWAVHVGAGPRRASYIVADLQTLRRMLELLAAPGAVRRAS